MPARTGSATTTAVVDGQRIEYRFRPGTGANIVVLPGAHMSASCSFGEHRILPTDAAVLVCSRPGYGRTPLAAGPSAPEFSYRLASLCRQLRLTDVTAVGISMGARTALTLAAQEPELVSGVVLLCPVSFAPWPEPQARRLALALFNPVVQAPVWGVLSGLLRNRPDVILPTAIRSLSTLPPHVALRRMGADLDELVRFLATCRSDGGFVNDLRPPVDVSVSVSQPTLVLAARNDRSVGFEHPERLNRELRSSRLVEVDAPSHLLWLGDGRRTVQSSVKAFLEGRLA